MADRVRGNAVTRGNKAASAGLYCIHIDEITGDKVRPDSVESTFKSTASFVRSELQ